jgi:hypothetical protein
MSRGSGSVAELATDVSLATELSLVPDLLAQVLEVYVPACRYLRSAEAFEAEAGSVGFRCALAIPESFYIRSTGHFNAVEFNLCYNQMMYHGVARMVADRLAAPFDAWSLPDYWARQLADFLIVDFRSSFHQGIDAASFSGELVFDRIRSVPGGRNWRPMVALDTSCRFWDDDSGRAEGTVRVMITNPPGAEQEQA